jgi:phosphoribosyl 1,2-cyclic phosphate phosphodiesterase
LIRTDQVTVAVDAGPDFRQQMLREGINKLDAVFITHEHKDHIGGLDDVRPFIFMNENKPMPLYVSKTALPEIKREFSYAFKEHLYPGAPTYEVHLIDETPFTFGDLYVEPIRLKHYTLTCYAFRIGRFAYVTDFHAITPAAMRRLQGVEYLIIEALARHQHYSHINLEQAVQIATDLHVKKAWFTHCSHSLGKAVDVNAELPENMRLAYDGLSFVV